jgi:hypothetical protein
MQIRTRTEAISHYGHDAYLLTVAQDGPHTSHVTIELRGSSLGDHTHEIRAASPRPQARRQRWALCERLPSLGAVTHRKARSPTQLGCEQDREFHQEFLSVSLI